MDSSFIDKEYHIEFGRDKCDVLWKLQVEDVKTDLSLVCSESEIKIHSIVAIANSEYISSLLKWDENCDKIKIQCDGDTLQCIVKIMYGQPFTVSQESILKLYRTGAFLLMLDLTNTLQSIFIKMFVDVDDIPEEYLLDFYQSMVLHGKTELLDIMYEYIGVNQLSMKYHQIFKVMGEAFFKTILNNQKLIFMDKGKQCFYVCDAFHKKCEDFISLSQTFMNKEEGNQFNLKKYVDCYKSSSDKYYIGLPSDFIDSTLTLATHPPYTYSYQEIAMDLVSFDSNMVNPLEWQLSSMKFYILENWDGRPGLVAGVSCEYLNIFTNQRKWIKPYDFKNSETVCITLNKGEYINRAVAYSGWLLDRFSFYTSQGRELPSVGRSDGGGRRVIDLQSVDDFDDSRAVGLFGFKYDVIESQGKLVMNNIVLVFSSIKRPKSKLVNDEAWMTYDLVQNL